MAKEKQYLFLFLTLPSASSSTLFKLSTLPLPQPPLLFSFSETSDSSSNGSLTIRQSSTFITAYHISDRARDILAMAASLLYGDGCGAITAATSYLLLPPLSDLTRQDQIRLVSPVMTRPSTDLTRSLLHHAVCRRRLHLDPAPAPPRLCFSSLLLQSASKSIINFYLSHTPSPNGGAIERSFSSLSSSDASSPAPYTTLSKRATCEPEIEKSTFITDQILLRALAHAGPIDPASHRLEEIDACSAECEVHIAQVWFEKTPVASPHSCDPPDGSPHSSDPPNTSPHSFNPIAPIPDPSVASIPAPETNSFS